MTSAGHFISIITPVLNGREGLRRCIESVLQQTGVRVEHIVADGGSTDGTLELLSGRNQPNLIWHSGPDKGVYDAMNKGIDMATGNWLMFLGSDDRLAGPNVLRQMVEGTDPSIGLLFGDVEYEDGRRFASTFSGRILFRNSIHHQGALYHRTLFDSRRFDERLKVYADYEFNVDLQRRRISAARRDVLVSICGAAGLSDVPRFKYYCEQFAIRRKHYPAGLALLGNCITLGRFAAKWSLRRLRRPAAP